jgi:hypothetical protein
LGRNKDALQARAVENLHVDSKLLAIVVEDKDADAATARLESLAEAAVEVGLVDKGKTLLNVTGLGHGDNVTVGHVQNTVLLEDGAKHGLHDNAGGRVGDEGGLLVQLLGEQVDTEVAVLASGRRGGDADHLARTTLEHQEVAQADVVAGDGDGVGEVSLARVTGARTRSSRLPVDVNVNVVVVLMATGVHDAVRELVNALAEGVVLAVVVVVTHVGFLVGTREASRLNGLFGDVSPLLVRGTGGDTGVNGEFVDTGIGLVLRLVGCAVYSSVVLGTKTLTVLTFGNVNGACVRLGDVNVNVSLVVLGARRTVLLVSKVLVMLVLGLGTGTAVTFFLTRVMDLFFAVALLSARRKFSRNGVRRVLTFPSGVVLGELDFELLLGFGLGLRLAVLVGRRKDAEGDRDSGFKVQIDDFCWRERIFSYNLP